MARIILLRGHCPLRLMASLALSQVVPGIFSDAYKLHWYDLPHSHSQPRYNAV